MQISERKGGLLRGTTLPEKAPLPGALKLGQALRTGEADHQVSTNVCPPTQTEAALNTPHLFLIMLPISLVRSDMTKSQEAMGKGSEDEALPELEISIPPCFSCPPTHWDRGWSPQSW